MWMHAHKHISSCRLLGPRALLWEPQQTCNRQLSSTWVTRRFAFLLHLRKREFPAKQFAR